MQINSTYILIDNKKALELAVINFQASQVISVDTESSSFYTYFPKVCLIQITSSNKNYIIDPLAKMDISLLGPVFQNEKILKIFHSAIDDIKALKRDFGFQFKNIADTMYSSKLLALEHNSLNHLVFHYHNLKLSKTEQKSNWEKRPLEKEQLKYAALDTAYLESIWTKMESELNELGLFEEASSEFEKFTEEIYKPRDSNAEIPWHKFPNIQKFSPEERRTIHDLLQFREEKAKRANKATFRIMNNDSLIKLVKEKPSAEEILKQFGKKDSEDIIKLLNEPSGPPFEKVETPKIDKDITPLEEGKLRGFHKWRDKVMKKRNMDHTMLLSNKQFLQILRNNCETIEDIQKLNLISEWKLKNYAPSLLKLIKNEPYEDLLENLMPIPKRK
ncbi:MAG: HRDC domain-containing protein [Leptospiraceae bacterium]|nr:HRDC domain-containing protein [Leptospiraceae bacterium]